MCQVLFYFGCRYDNSYNTEHRKKTLKLDKALKKRSWSCHEKRKTFSAYNNEFIVNPNTDF